MFHNRKDELKALETAYNSSEPEFIVIYGRRRIGKTSLVKQMTKDYPVLYHLAEKLPFDQQALDFAEQVADETGSFKPQVSDWKEAFEFALSQFDRRVIIAIDEFPYLINADDRVLSHFQKLWDEYLSEEDIVLILIGSSISIMENEVLDYKSPLFGRRTRPMEIKEIPIGSFRDFFPSSDHEDIVRIYGACGGVPAYLKRFDGSKTFWENISDNFFHQDRYMFNEPVFILQQELREPSAYKMILKAISGGKHRIGKIANEIHRPVTDLPRYLTKLERLRIIEKEVPYGKSAERSRDTRYVIKDNLMLFYFRYIYPHRGLIIKGNISDAMGKLKKDYNRYLGHIYERIVKENIYDLDIPIQRCGRWWHKDKEIDLIAESDNTVYKCEVKWKNLSFQDISRILEGLKEIKTPFEKDKKIKYIIVGKEVEEYQDESLHLFGLQDIIG